MDGAVAVITQHVKGQLHALRLSGSRPYKRALLVLDGCTQHVVVGQERVDLKSLLARLISALRPVGLTLTAAVTMSATGPMAPGRVGVPGEKMVVVEALDDRRYVGLDGLFHFYLPIYLSTVGRVGCLVGGGGGGDGVVVDPCIA